MSLPQEYRYTKDHEWVSVVSESGDLCTVKIGITEFAQDQLGELVFVDLPQVGTEIEAKDTICVVESTKAASDVYSPVSGKVSAVNKDLQDTPALVNKEPYTGGWIATIEGIERSQLEGLLDADAYAEIIS